jgi:hypothetical protein
MLLAMVSAPLAYHGYGIRGLELVFENLCLLPLRRRFAQSKLALSFRECQFHDGLSLGNLSHLIITRKIL